MSSLEEPSIEADDYLTPSTIGSSPEPSEPATLPREGATVTHVYDNVRPAFNDDSSSGSALPSESALPPAPALPLPKKSAQAEQHTVEIPQYQKLINEDRPKDFAELSTLACVCNFVVGIVALNFALRSKESWETGDRKYAKIYGCAALVTSVIALLTVIAIVLGILYEEDVINW